MRRRIVGLFVLLLFISSIGSTAALAAPLSLTVGMSVSAVNETELNAAGYQFIDDTDPDIVYGWPYSLENRQASEQAYGGGTLSAFGQVSASFTYEFTGTFLAVAFAENYWASEIIITIDGAECGSATPHNPNAPKEAPGDSKIIFIKDDLPEGKHLLTVSHKTAYTSGDENIKADGNAYYDNDAFFDCLIVENQNRVIPDEVTVNTKMNYYSDEMLADWGLKAIRNDDPAIQYAWPYDLGIRVSCPGAYSENAISNVGQVSASFSYDFEGTYLAAAFGEVYYACTIIITIDGEKVGEITPHTAVKTEDGSVPSQSKVVFVKDDLAEGKHTVTITHEVAYTTGEDNIREDGNAYYDNYALFDCFIVEADSNQTEPEITPAPENTPGSGDNIPVTGDKTSFAAAFCIIAAAAAAIFAVIKRKSEA